MEQLPFHSKGFLLSTGPEMFRLRFASISLASAIVEVRSISSSYFTEFFLLHSLQTHVFGGIFTSQTTSIICPYSQLIRQLFEHPIKYCSVS